MWLPFGAPGQSVAVSRVVVWLPATSGSVMVPAPPERSIAYETTALSGESPQFSLTWSAPAWVTQVACRVPVALLSVRAAMAADPTALADQLAWAIPGTATAAAATATAAAMRRRDMLTAASQRTTG